MAMKKVFAILIILTMVFSLTACGSENDNNVSSADDASGSSVEDSSLQGEEAFGPLSENTNTQGESSSGEFAAEGSSEQGSNILVAYFSRVGNTVWESDVDAVTSASLNVEDGEFVGNAEYLAKMAAEATGGDLFLIQTEETYPSDYRETTNLASEEKADNARPALASHVENMDQYDTIVLIYPKMEYGFDCVLCA